MTTSLCIPIILTDIDECLTGANNCSDDALCADTNGGYNCTCKRGFEGDGFACSGECFSILICSTLSRTHVRQCCIKIEFKCVFKALYLVKDVGSYVQCGNFISFMKLVCETITCITFKE